MSQSTSTPLPSTRLETACRAFVLVVCLVLAFAWLRKDELTLKEMQIMCIVETHAEKGLGFTGGYNVYPERGGKYSDIDHTKMGGIPYGAGGAYTAYVSVPVLVPLATWIVYEATGHDVKASKIFFVALTFVCLFILFRVASRFSRREERIYFILFTLCPFFVFSYVYNDINLNSFVLCFSLLSYLYFLRFLDQRSGRDLAVAVVSLVIASWSSFFVLALYPIFLLHLWFDRRVPSSAKLRHMAIAVAIMGAILASLVAYYSQLPGAVQLAVSRAAERVGGVTDMGAYQKMGAVPLTHFISKLVIRLLSHFTPIAVALSALGLVTSGWSLVQEVRRNGFAVDTLSLPFATLMAFLFGAPAALFLYTGSFVHPYFTFQWIPFFIVGSVAGLRAVMTWFPRRGAMVAAVIVALFVALAVPRSIAKVTSRSLVDILFGGKIPSWYKQTK